MASNHVFLCTILIQFFLVFAAKSMLPSNPKIVVVGGGVSGIAAATKLVEKGFNDVILLEAEDRLGGRVYTVPFGDSHVDLGAHWVHGEVGNPVFEIASRLDLLKNSQDFTSIEFVADDGYQFPADVGMELYESGYSILTKTEELLKSRGSVEAYLVPRFEELAREKIKDPATLKAFTDWLVKFECTIEGCDRLSEPSINGLTHYKTCDGDATLCWKQGGYNNIVNILLGQHPSAPKENPLNGKVFLNSEVTEIDWSGLTGFVRIKDGRTVVADHIIVTVSLGVLKEKHGAIFKPKLPQEKIKAIQGLGIGTVDKIYLKFERRWWPKDCSGFSLLRKNQSAPLETGEHSWERDLIGFYAESTSPNVLGGWVVGDAAREMETSTDAQVMAGCMRTLRKFLGSRYEIPDPQTIIRSKWYTNSHFRGSYSYRSVSTDVLNTSAAALAEPVKNFYGKEMLFFAGEATHDYFYSTVHGALESGWREGERLATKYRKVAKCSL
ncbi:Flavin containing amine oxidoreductase [Nesidiocoris tenuis]|uniref:Flavin containing amine oxidoreductase n=1 Tax=Nesidiocoris tenuis TaxID=355587 RepID=A0ABN7BBH9_9HEMI|nr:Flavin containing amine oxidoreductase [Nesidiocoris tenuis]